MLKILKKVTTIILFSSLSLSASAAFIHFESDQSSYTVNEEIMVDVWINKANAQMDWLDFDMAFNADELLFDEFMLTDEVFDNTWFDFAAEYNVGGLTGITVNVGFIELWESALTDSFKLGTTRFTALTDVSNLNHIHVAYLDVQDINGDSISPQRVPEPSTLLLLLVAGLLFHKRLQKTE